MSRSYARIMTAIWRDKDFLALDVSPQRTYLMLVTQPDISAAGTLPLRVRRWASLAANSTGTTLGADLQTLTEARFIVADKKTEELLIRSFVRWDGGHTNGKRLPVIVAAADAVDSAPLREALALEFERLGMDAARLREGLSDAPADSASHSLSDGLSDSGSDMASVIDIDVAREERAILAISQVDSASDVLSEAVSDGLFDAVSGSNRVVGYVSTVGTTTRNPETATSSADAGDESPTAQSLVAGWIDSCAKRPPKNVIGQIAKHVKALLDEAIDPGDIRAGLVEWRAKGGLHPSTLPSIVNGVMNGSGQSGSYRPFQNPTDDPADYEKGWTS